jgi:hypothetical protein
MPRPRVVQNLGALAAGRRLTSIVRMQRSLSPLWTSSRSTVQQKMERQKAELNNVDVKIKGTLGRDG